jgi:segregation and condensation protein B
MNGVVEVVEAAEAFDDQEVTRTGALEEQSAAPATGETASSANEDEPHAVQSVAERRAIIEALIFVSDEPISTKTIAEVLSEDRALTEEAVGALANEFNARGGGLQLREVGGGWQFATRPEHHEHVRAFLKSRPSAKLSLASLETLAVIAYKQPITIAEILAIRGVQSP